MVSSRIKYEQFFLQQSQQHQSTAAEIKRKMMTDINFAKQKMWVIEKEM